MQVSSAILD